LTFQAAFIYTQFVNMGKLLDKYRAGLIILLCWALALSGATAWNAAGSLGLHVTSISSSSISVAWARINNATSTKVFMGAEPGNAVGAPMPGELEIAVLDGTVSAYTVTELAPAVDVFIRVEVHTSTNVFSEHVHARTKGGPRASLTTPVREVHLYSPRILEIVIAGGDGPALQAGSWTVQRSDGSSINVESVHRHSVAVGAPAYQIGYGLPADDSVIDVDHRVFLVLNQPIGNREILHVTGPGIDFTLPFSDLYLETPVIQLNQVGYSPRATKRWAYVYGWLGDGGALSFSDFPATADVIREASDPRLPREYVLRNLAITVRASYDDDAGGEVREIDLSSLPPGGYYRVRIPGVGVSWRTEVSESAVFRAYYVVMRGLFFNRWGGNLSSSYTNWSRPPDHPFVYTGEEADFTRFYPEDQPRIGQRSLVGGYHDAGDFDQRPMHTVVPQLLMRAYEINPQLYSDGQLNIPESGNGIPDILDEALWGIAAWEQLQEEDGGVRQGVESYRHPWGYYFASDDPLPYWTYARDPRITARAAGLFAQAARLIRPFSPQRSNELQQRAIAAYAWAKAHRTDATDIFLLYGAGELLLLTEEAKYNNDFIAIWRKYSPELTWWEFPPMALSHLELSDYIDGERMMPDYILGYYRSPQAHPNIKNAIDFWLARYANDAVNSIIDSEHAHRNPRPPAYGVYWGNGVNSAKYMDPVIADIYRRNVTADSIQSYFDALSLAADFILGANPAGLVYITGLGSRHPMEPLHLDALVFIKQHNRPPMPGIPSYGPVDSFPGASYSQPAGAAFYPAFNEHPRALRYADVRTVPPCSEFTVWEMQAPIAELFALLIALQMSPESLSDNCGIDHCMDDLGLGTIEPFIFSVSREGNVYAAGAFFSSQGADVAEWVPTSEPLEPGDVIELDPDNPGSYRKTHGPYSALVIGVVSSVPGVILGETPSGSKALLALLGTVPVKATDENGPIHPGDLLVSASRPGYAMRCDDREKCKDAIFGKALEQLENGTGIIRVLLMR
jgi:endoglucanase